MILWPAPNPTTRERRIKMADKLLPKVTKEEAERRREERERREARERQQRKEAADKSAARRSWMAAGGNEANFEQNWPRIRDEMRAERVKREAAHAQAETRRAYRSAF